MNHDELIDVVEQSLVECAHQFDKTYTLVATEVVGRLVPVIGGNLIERLAQDIERKLPGLRSQTGREFAEWLRKQEPS